MNTVSTPHLTLRLAHETSCQSGRTRDAGPSTANAIFLALSKTRCCGRWVLRLVSCLLSMRASTSPLCMYVYAQPNTCALNLPSFNPVLWLTSKPRRLQYADKRQHHVINNYYDAKGTKVKNEGQIWNFHSWNDLWLNNVLGTEAGWCALDGTPPGTVKYFRLLEKVGRM